MDSLMCLPREIIAREILPWLDHNTMLVFSQCCKFFAALSKEHVKVFPKFRRKIIERNANERTKVQTIFEWKHPLLIETEPLEVLSMTARVSRQKYYVVLTFEVKLTPTYQRIFGHLILHCHRTRKHKREDEFWKVRLRGDVLLFETTPLSGSFLGRKDHNALPRKIRTDVKKAVLWDLQRNENRPRGYVHVDYATIVPGDRIRFQLCIKGTVSSGLLGHCIGFGNSQNYVTAFSEIQGIFAWIKGGHISVEPF